MKKLLKGSLLLAIMAIFVFALTGCAGNKLVATKTEDDSTFGKYEEKVEIKFKNKVATEMKRTMTFKDEDTAKKIVDLYKAWGEDEGMTQKGKKVIIKKDVTKYAESAGIEKDKLTKDYLKKLLEDEGYKVK